MKYLFLFMVVLYLESCSPEKDDEPAYADFIYTIIDKESNKPVIGYHATAVFHPDSFEFQYLHPFVISEFQAIEYEDSTVNFKIFIDNVCESNRKVPYSPPTIFYSGSIFDRFLLVKDRASLNCASWVLSEKGENNLVYTIPKSNPHEILDTMKILY
jgi:hypothetical protein